MKKVIVIASPYTVAESTDSDDSESLISMDDTNIANANNVVKTKELRFVGDEEIQRFQTIFEGTIYGRWTFLNELSDSIFHTWSDIHRVSVGYNATNDQIEQDWEVFCSLAKFKSLFEIGDIYSPKTEDVSIVISLSLYKDMSYDFYRFFKKMVLSNCTLPTLISSNPKLQNIHEQMVFYEYIYQNSNYTLFHKIRWIVDNNYWLLIDLLEENLLEITSFYNYKMEEGYQYHNYLLLLAEYINNDSSDEESVSRYMQLLELHNNVLGKGIDTIKNSRTYLDYSTDFVPTFDISDCGAFNAVFQNKAYHFIDAVCSDKNLKHLAKLACISPVRENTNTLYCKMMIIDIIVRMLESDMDLTRYGLTERLQSNILYKWLYYARLVLNNNNTRFVKLKSHDGSDVPFESRFLLRTFTRDLIITDTMMNLFKKSYPTFSELAYVYYKDLVNVFDVITRNCTFARVDNSILEYYPTKIIKSIEQKTNQDIATHVKDCSINIHKLAMIDPNRIRSYILLVRSNCNFDLVTDAINDFVENEYICMYHELSEINSSKLETIAKYVYYTDMSIANPDILGVLFDNYGKIGALSTMLYSMNIANPDNQNPICRSYVEYMINMSDYFFKAPDLGEIYSELSVFNNLSTISGKILEIINERNSICSSVDIQESFEEYHSLLQSMKRNYDNVINNGELSDSDSDEEFDSDEFNSDSDSNSDENIWSDDSCSDQEENENSSFSDSGSDILDYGW